MKLTKLSKVRNNSGLTYQQVADKLMISKQFYWMIENGQRKLTYSMAVRIADIFGMKPDDIFLQSELTKS